MPLSLRESEVFNLLEKGYTLKQIAIRLNVAKSTIQTYKKRIHEKLKNNNKNDKV